jgi:hypothetical protein
MAAAPHPDARLVMACDRFMALSEECARLWRLRSRGYLKVCRSMWPERDALEVEISNTPARTAAGRLAKAEVAMHMLGTTGTIAMTARSVLHDFINATSQQGVA